MEIERIVDTTNYKGALNVGGCEVRYDGTSIIITNKEPSGNRENDEKKRRDDIQPYKVPYIYLQDFNYIQTAKGIKSFVFCKK